MGMGLVIVLGLSSDVSLGLNGADLGEFVGFEVSKTLLESVHLSRGDSRRKQLL